MSSDSDVAIRTVEPAQLRAAIDGFCALTWPVRRSVAAEMIGALGWNLVTSIDDPFVEADTGYELTNSLAMVDFKEDNLIELSFELVDVVAEETPWRADALRDAFVRLVALVREQLGKPNRQEPGDEPSATWELPNGGRFFVSQGRSGIGASLSSKAWADVNRAMGQ